MTSRGVGPKLYDDYELIIETGWDWLTTEEDWGLDLNEEDWGFEVA